MPLNPYDISSIYADMELDLITSMKQNLTRHRKEELKEGFKWEQWQKAKLKDIRRFQKQNKKVIADYQAVIDSQTSDLLKESYRQGKKNSNSFIKRMMDKVKEKFEAKEKRFFVNNDDKVKALMKTVKGDLHNANYAALRQMDDVYRKTLFKAQMYYSNGAVSLEKAIDMATKDFLNKGIDCITYKNGRKVNIASYAEMAVRTSNQRAMLMGEGTKRAEYGIHTVCSSIHSNTCQLCLAWQGKVLIDDVYSGGTKEDGSYPLLSTAMAEGFLHANCRHHPTTFFPDINKEPKELTEDEQQEALEKYNAEQKQRKIERDIKKWKRVEAGSTDPDNLAAAHTRVEQLQAQMKQHLQDNPHLRREPWREKLRESTINKEYEKSSRKDLPNSVDWEKVNSQEYRDKFRGITDSVETDNLLCEKARDMLKHRNNTDYEDMHIINLENKKVVASQTHAKDKRTPGRNKEIDTAYKKYGEGALVSIHNHPSSLLPSDGDFNSQFANNALKKGIVVSHNGDIYVYKKGNKPILELEYKLKVAKYKKRGYNEYEAQLKALEEYKASHGIKFEKR